METTLTSIRVSLPDDLVLQLEAEARTSGQSVETVVAERLTAFGPVVPTERHLTLNQVDLAELDTALGGRPVKDAKDLLSRVRRAGAVSLGEVRLDLTQSQKERLIGRAKRNDRSYRQEVELTVRHLLEQIVDVTG